MQKILGDRVDEESKMSDFLIAEGFEPRSIKPAFSDLPSREYINGDLSVSFSRTHHLFNPKDTFLVLRVRHDKENYRATLPLDNVGRYLDSRAA